MNINELLENLRVNYRNASLDLPDCNPVPELQFDHWFENTIKSKCDEPNAFVLSTVSNNKPHARVVLLKGIHRGEFVFYSNYSSSKGEEIKQNSNVAMTFLWLPLQRQVRIEGTVKQIPDIYSDDYFHKRPRGNQIGAIASPQSQKVSSRAELESLFHQAEVDNADKAELTRPTNWGGYGITPNRFEFWQGRANRMHDRIVYEKISGEWKLSRLAP